MNDEQLIIESEQALAKAHVESDWAKIDALLHDKYVIVQPNGALETKHDVLSSFHSGNRIWKSAKVDQLDVILFGNTARVIGRWTATGFNNGAAFDYQARFVSVWLKTNDRWQNIAYSSGEIK